MPNTSAFALRDSGLNPFLFAEVGTELNGSTLTMLSVLARLGQDPWDQAGRWAKLPKAVIVDRLMQCITQMPLCPQALVDARATAWRLIQLLPGQVAETPPVPVTKIGGWAIPGWAPTAFFCLAVAAGIALSALMTPGPTATAPTVTEQTVNPAGGQ